MLLPMAQFAYNSHKNETTGLSSFYANYGFKPEAYQEALPTERWAQASKISVDKLKSIHEQLSKEIALYRCRHQNTTIKGARMHQSLKKGIKYTYSEEISKQNDLAINSISRNSDHSR